MFLTSPGVIVGVVISIISIVILCYLISRFRIVRQTNKYIVERLGGFHSTWSVGIHFLVPFVDRIAYVVSMKEQVKDFDPQPVITKDNVTMQIDSIVFFGIAKALEQIGLFRTFRKPELAKNA